MDILTPRGQQTRVDEDVAARVLETRLNVRYVHTAKDEPATIDAIILDDSGTQVRAIAETKCRYDVTYDEFIDRYDNEWLVTWEKISKGIDLAKHMRVPFVGILHLTQSGVVLVVRISEADGRLAVPLRLQTTSTQATVNGGTAVRTNAFIYMASAKRYDVA